LEIAYKTYPTTIFRFTIFTDIIAWLRSTRVVKGSGTPNYFSDSNHRSVTSWFCLQDVLQSLNKLYISSATPNFLLTWSL